MKCLVRKSWTSWEINTTKEYVELMRPLNRFYDADIVKTLEHLRRQTVNLIVSMCVKLYLAYFFRQSPHFVCIWIKLTYEQ